MTEFLITIVGYLFIYSAVDLNRNEESEIKPLSKYWFWKVALVTTGGVILGNLQKIVELF